MKSTPAPVPGLPSGAAWHGRGVDGTTPVGPRSLADAIRDAALALGFARVGFCPIEPFEKGERALADWLAAGRHGEMSYMAGEIRSDPLALLPRARSLIVVALPYTRDGLVGVTAPGAPVPLTGLVARYARGQDYHSVLKQRLRRLADRCAELSGRPVLARPCVDTAPLLEREAARRAGIGFTAKSTLTIAPGLGSYFLLGELLTDLELAPSEPIASSCGSCRACLDACPTAAFVDAYTLDARRCISYLTIELQGSIPRALRPLIGRWVFGCDICQEVCPFNHSPKPRPSAPELAPRRSLTDPDLIELLHITSSGYRRFVRGTALKRVSRHRLQRNAAVALGNTRSPAAAEPVARALMSNPSPLVRAHCAWALGQIGTEVARLALSEARQVELDATVIEELEEAIIFINSIC